MLILQSVSYDDISQHISCFKVGYIGLRNIKEANTETIQLKTIYTCIGKTCQCLYVLW